MTKLRGKPPETLVALANEQNMHPATLAVAWAATHPAVSAPLISGKNVAQLQPSLDALKVELSDSLKEKLQQISRTPPPATDRLEER